MKEVLLFWPARILRVRTPGGGDFLFWKIAAAAWLLLAALGAAAGPAELRARHDALRQQLRDSPYQRPLQIDSVESGDTLRGEAYAVLDHPFDTLSRTLKDPAEWCAVLILPFNTKYCHATDGPQG